MKQLLKILQEQIEDVSKERNEIKDIMKLLDKCVSLNPMCKAEVATIIYDNNYRKIPEDIVVLTKDELNDENHLAQRFGYDLGSKETAEKIYAKIKGSFLMNSNNRYALKLWIEEQLGLEIKE